VDGGGAARTNTLSPAMRDGERWRGLVGAISTFSSLIKTPMSLGLESKGEGREARGRESRARKGHRSSEGP